MGFSRPTPKEKGIKGAIGADTSKNGQTKGIKYAADYEL
jgi:hypothetical protein